MAAACSKTIPSNNTTRYSHSRNVKRERNTYDPARHLLMEGWTPCVEYATLGRRFGAVTKTEVNSLTFSVRPNMNWYCVHSKPQKEAQVATYCRDTLKLETYF